MLGILTTKPPARLLGPFRGSLLGDSRIRIVAAAYGGYRLEGVFQLAIQEHPPATGAQGVLDCLVAGECFGPFRVSAFGLQREGVRLRGRTIARL